MMKEFLVIFASFVLIGSGCLITNCPRGGKRGGSAVSIESVARECPTCGPNHMGQCFGPEICCGSGIGCFIGTPETFRCRKESLFSRPCIAGFAMCRGNTARCAANGICCSQESCNIDATCRINGGHKSDSDLNVIITENESSNEIILE